MAWCLFTQKSKQTIVIPSNKSEGRIVPWQYMRGVPNLDYRGDKDSQNALLLLMTSLREVPPPPMRARAHTCTHF